MTSENLDEKHKQAEIKKLELEIKNLEKAHKWNIITQFIPVITVLIAVSGFVFGIIQYKVQRQTDNNLREKEFKKRYWEKQLEVYGNLSQSAARLATLDDAQEREKEYQRFREIYFGNFLMVADPNVAQAAKTFYQKYIDYRNDPTKQVEVQLSSKDLGNTCAASLRLTWDVPLKGEVSQ